MSPSASSPAPWRDMFVKHVAAMDQATFTLSTINSDDGTPRGRTCIYRGIWGSLPENDKNKAPRNPSLFTSDLPVFTSDARMAKVPELSSSGGAVEAMWWCEPSKTQWRLRGKTYVLGAKVDDETRAALRARMRRTTDDADGEKEWSWEREVTGHFGNLSPMMRGTFRNPPPGTPRAISGGDGEELGQKVEDLEDELARKNFRVCVIVPDEVDLCDLSQSDDPRRWIYTYIGSKEGTKSKKGAEVIGDWEKCETWP